MTQPVTAEFGVLFGAGYGRLFHSGFSVSKHGGVKRLRLFTRVARAGLGPLAAPVPTFQVAISNGSSTSTPAVPFAQEAGGRRRLGERVDFDPLPPFLISPVRAENTRKRA